MIDPPTSPDGAVPPLGERPRADGSAVATTRAGSPAPAVRWLVWPVLLVIALHTAVIALWVGPNNLVKDHLGTAALRGYVLPMFDQAWRVFAPEPDYSYDLFEVRAVVADPSGAETETDWIPVTLREVGPVVRYHPFPSRTAVMSTRLAADLLRSYNGLDADQRERVAAADRSVTPGQLADELIAAAGDDQDQVRAAGRYARADEATEYFLSGIAEGVWGDRVRAFAFRRYRISVVRYTEQSADRQVRSDYDFTSPWRPIHPLTPADRTAFAGYVRELGIGAG